MSLYEQFKEKLVVMWKHLTCVHDWKRKKGTGETADLYYHECSKCKLTQ